MSMLTFMEFKEIREKRREEKALGVVRKGMNLKTSDDFWDDFLRMCGDSEGMSALLDVPKDKITGLSGRIGKMKRKVEELDGRERKTNDKLITTGKLK